MKQLCKRYGSGVSVTASFPKPKYENVFLILVYCIFFITGSIPMNLKMTRTIFLIGKTMNETVDHQEMDQFEGL